MVSSGIPMLECIESLKQQPYSQFFRSILQVISEDVKGGMMLSEAIDKHEKVFPDFFRSMVHVGEASGKLDKVFVSLADYYESDASIKRKAKSALAYPLILGLMTVAIAALMLIFVIPMFRDTLSNLEVEVSGLTAAIYKFSDFMLLNWHIVVLLIIVVFGGAFLFFKTKSGKKIWDVIKVKCPYVGAVQIDLITARFSRAFSVLLSSGMGLAAALDTVSVILGNSYVKARFDEAADDVRHGVTLTNAFKKQNLFPHMLIEMLSVGEKTASLEEVLNRSCSFFDEQVETSLNSLTAKIQPVMLIIMGLVVGTLFVAVYSPMLSIMTTLR